MYTSQSIRISILIKEKGISFYGEQTVTGGPMQLLVVQRIRVKKFVPFVLPAVSDAEFALKTVWRRLLPLRITSPKSTLKNALTVVCALKSVRRRLLWLDNLAR